MNRALTHSTLVAWAATTTAAMPAAVRTVPVGSASRRALGSALARAAYGTGRKESTFHTNTFASIDPPRTPTHPCASGVRIDTGTTRLNVCGERTSTALPKVVPDVRTLSAARATARGTAFQSMSEPWDGRSTGTKGRRHAA